MVLFDVNILLYAFRADAPEHSVYKRWLEEILRSETVCGVSDLVLAAVVRIATHPRIGRRPATPTEALEFVESLRNHPGCASVSPGQRHWQIFAQLCRATGARGPLVTDAYFAALAIESGAEWITTDRDYARFSGLRWRHPLA